MFFLETKDLKKNFGGVQALKNGSVCIKQGRICGLLGANGSGKTTLSRLLTGIYRLTSGSIKIEDKEVHIKNPGMAEKLGIVMVHQNLSLAEELTVWENIMLGHEMMKSGRFVDKKACIAAAREVLARLTDDISVYTQVKELSPSQKQLVEIAKALSKKARLLILDEPTAALTKSEVEKLFKIMNSLKAQGITMIFISHRLWEVMTICDQVVVLRNGETVEEIDFEYEEKEESRIVAAITGGAKDGICKLRKDEGAGDETVLRLDKVGSHDVLADIDFELKKGEILGVAGLQGQGQEQLLEVISGTTPYHDGEMHFEGTPMKHKSTKQFIRDGIVLVPGDRHKEGLFLNHSIYDNTIFPQFARKRSRVFVDKKQMKNDVQETIDRLHIVPDDQSKPVKLLSGGNQQKVVVGKWLALNPKVFLLSDPAKGVDIGAKTELYNLVCELAADGAAFVLYASDNDELLSICDRILIMFEGRVVDVVKNDGMTDEALTAAIFNASKIASHGS